MTESIEALIERAKQGDRTALEKVILSVKDLVYNLSLKMLLFPEDAKDASQDILIRIVTHLGTFRGKSSFKTWVYRVACNHLLTVKGRKSAALAMSFEDYATLIDTGQRPEVGFTQNEGEIALLEEEVKVSCTQGLLLCLNEKSRLVYILGEILEFNSREGGVVMGITPDNFRQILARARKRLRHFLEAKCGLVNPANPCRCKRKIDFLIEREVVDPDGLRYAPLTRRSIELIERLSHLGRTVALYRSVPDLVAPPDLLTQLKKTLETV